MDQNQLTPEQFSKLIIDSKKSMLKDLEKILDTHLISIKNDIKEVSVSVLELKVDMLLSEAIFD